MDSKMFTGLPKDELSAKIKEVVLSLQTLQGSDFLDVCALFSGDINQIDQVLTKSDAQKQSEFDDYFNVNPTIEVFQDTQIRLCVMASLTTEELTRLRQGILTKQAMDHGFEGYFERLRMVEDTAKRCIEMIDILKHEESEDYPIAKTFIDKYSSAFPSLLITDRTREDIEEEILKELMQTTNDVIQNIMVDLKAADIQLGRVYQES